MNAFGNLEELRDWLNNNGHVETVVFRNPEYLGAIIGISSNGSLVYSYSKMIECLMLEDEMSSDCAADFIDFNTLGSLPSNKPFYPIVIFDMD